MSKRHEEFKSPEGLVTVTKHALSDDANPLEFCNHIQDGWIYWRDLEAQIKDTALNILAKAGFSSAADVPADASPATVAGAAIRVLQGMDHVQFFIDRKEAERRKANAANATASNTSSGSSVKTAKVIELAPETVLVNTDFEKNKGGLPWPISAGVITSRFGKHPHTSLEQVIVNNNGLDFTTEKNASALAIFSGTVSSVFNIPGAGQNVIVTHGSYKSVYSGLSDVNVEVGDKIDAKQKIGTVMYDGEEYTLHFEVWKVGSEAGSAQNPELWIKKRG